MTGVIILLIVLVCIAFRIRPRKLDTKPGPFIFRDPNAKPDDEDTSTENEQWRIP